MQQFAAPTQEAIALCLIASGHIKNYSWSARRLVLPLAKVLMPSCLKEPVVANLAKGFIHREAFCCHELISHIFHQERKYMEKLLKLW